MEIVIEKICIDGEVVIGFIPCENAVEYVSNELYKYEHGIGDCPYFNWYRERMIAEDDYRFGWHCNFDDKEFIADTKEAYIQQDKENYIEWHII